MRMFNIYHIYVATNTSQQTCGLFVSIAIFARMQSSKATNLFRLDHRYSRNTTSCIHFRVITVTGIGTILIGSIAILYMESTYTVYTCFTIYHVLVARKKDTTTSMCLVIFEFQFTMQSYKVTSNLRYR